MPIQLSRGFTTVHTSSPTPYLKTKSVAALALGIFPFLIHTVARTIFKKIANFANDADSSGQAILRKFIGTIGIPTAAAMCGSAKLFAMTQLLVWKHYVRKPEGDSANTRLAWYGADQLPLQDFQAIVKAFFKPQATPDTWTLKQWSEVEL